MGAPSIDRLLRPKSVAVVGASDKPGALGASVLANLDGMGFKGEIHLINPNRTEIGGRPCLKSVDELPENIDVAVLAIPRVGVLDAMRGLANRKVGAAIIFSAGFAEGGEEGLAAQREIADIARNHGVVVEGPNCLGMVNYVDSVALTFVETPPRSLKGERAIGIVSQSGAMAAVLAVTLASRDLDISYSISTGNEAASGVEDYIDYLLDDPHTKVIGLIVEHFRNPQRFLDLARRARQRSKPLVLLHPGRSAAARASAATHTGALAGDYEVMRLKVGNEGVAIAECLEELGDMLEVLSRCRAPIANGAAVLGESGAFKALTLDLAEQIDLDLPALSDADSPALRAAMPEFIPVSNPLDLTAQSLVDPTLYRRTIEALATDDRIGVIILGIIQTDEKTAHIKFPQIIGAVEELKPAKPILFAGLDEGAPAPFLYIEKLRAIGVPYFPSADRACRAAARLARCETAPRADISDLLNGFAGLKDAKGVVPEHEAKNILASLGVPLPKGGLAKSLDDAAKEAERAGYPVALKAQSEDLPHKSDAGGVALNIADESALRVAWTKMRADVERCRPGVALDGILVERMGERGVELIVGARNDPDWGAVVLVGIGGVQAELLKDVRLLSPDLPRDAILNEIRSLKCAGLLLGFRGAPPADIEAVADIVSRVGALMMAEPSIREIDLNPVVVYPQREGALALDALMHVEAGQ